MATGAGARLASGTMWAFVGAFVARALGLASSIVVARVLGREALGEFGIIQNTVDMFQLFAGFGLGLTATKYVAQYRVSDPPRAGRVMILSGLVVACSAAVVAITLVIAGPWVAANTLAAPHLTGVLRIGAITLFLGALNGAQLGALGGFEAFRTRTLVSTLSGLATPILVVAGASSRGVSGAVWGIAGSAAFAWFVNHVAVRYEARRAGVPLVFGLKAEDWKMLWHFSFPALLASMMVTPVDWACAAMLVNQPHGYSEMGIFRVVTQWFGVVIFLPRVAGGVFLPVLSERIGAGDMRSVVRIFRVLVGATAAVATPLVCILSFASPWIMAMYGPGFAAGWTALVLGLATSLIVSLQGPIGHLIAASGRMWLGFVMNTAWAIVYLVATLLLVRFGANGLAGARLLAYLFHAAWTFWWALSVMHRPRVLAAGSSGPQSGC
jgi:O-antigen/teichoic acid export membrane protein